MMRTNDFQIIVAIIANIHISKANAIAPTVTVFICVESAVTLVALGILVAVGTLVALGVVGAGVFPQF